METASLSGTARAAYKGPSGLKPHNSAAGVMESESTDTKASSTLQHHGGGGGEGQEQRKCPNMLFNMSSKEALQSASTCIG